MLKERLIILVFVHEIYHSPWRRGKKPPEKEGNMKEMEWGEVYEMASEALIKQIPAKPVRVSNDRTDGCPICKEEFYKKVNYCPKCGKKIDWTGKEKR